MNRSFPYQTGFVLSGGAARGFAHLGIIKALKETGIFPDVLSGTSAGSIVGAFCADGYDPEEIMHIFLKKRIFNFVRLGTATHGFLSMSGLEKVLGQTLHAKTFADLKVPLYICATNYNTGKPVYFHQGVLIPRIIASSSIPVIFTPKRIGRHLYVDGGVLDNLPVAPVRNRCSRLIGMHVNPVGEEKDAKGLLKIAERSFHLAMSSEVEHKLKYFDLFIRPGELREFGLMDVRKGPEMFDIGYRTAREVLKHYTPSVPE